MYTPGMVRAGQNPGTSLKPLDQLAGDKPWQVEPGIRLHHFSQGQGRPVLVVHGGPGYPFAEPLTGLEPLAGDFEFVYYDQRGCGESTRPFDRFESRNAYANMQTLERTLGVGAQLADIERIRRILGEEKLILVGHSWGGFLAALYAAEFPEHVEALVLVSPAEMLVMPPPEGGLFASVEKRLPPEKAAEFQAFMDTYLNFGGLFSHSEAELVALNQQFAQYYVDVAGSDLATPESSMPAQGEPGGWMVFAQYLSLGQRHDYRSALAAVDAPVLVIHGAQDLQSEAASRSYAEVFPNARFETLAQSGHFAFEQQPEAFAALVGKFLKPYQ
jgi:proline iminopeptidase